MEGLAERPLISLVMPAYDTDPRYLREAIGSVRSQSYENWELFVVDDCSPSRSTRRAIERAASSDPRIQARLLEENSGISNATNSGLELCRGELVGFLDHDDVLTADALLEVARAFSAHEIDVAYSDQDKITADGEVTDPFLKPDWSPVYALGVMYVGHLLVARRELVSRGRRLRPRLRHDPGLRATAAALRADPADPSHPAHPLPLARIPGSIALSEAEKPGVTELQASAVNAHLRRFGIAADAVPHEVIPHRLRLRPVGRPSKPAVSVVVPSRDGAGRALAALRERTAYPELEVVVEERDGAFRPARQANRGARRASGDYLVFLGEDAEVTEPDWIEQLLLYARMPDVGAVAPALVHPDGRVDAAGVVIGLYDPAVPAMRGFAAVGDGYYGSLSCAREVSAAGGDCMLIRRSTFDDLGGFEEAFNRQFHDVDLCLRLGQLGLTVICTPAPPTISHTTEARRRSDFDVIDRGLFVDRWYERLKAGDAYYHGGFLGEATDYAPSPFSGDPHALAMREAVG